MKRLKLLKGDLVDVGQHVIVKVELSEVNKPGKLVAVKLLDVVVVQVELSKVGETGEGVVADGGDVAVVQVELLHSVPAQEVLLVDVNQVVAVKMERSGVHGDEDGHVAVVVAGAGDDVEGPVGVVLALAAEGALHAAVASVEVATHAAGEAVRLVAAEELFFGHVNDERSLDRLVDISSLFVIVVDDDFVMTTLLLLLSSESSMGISPWDR